MVFRTLLSGSAVIRCIRAPSALFRGNSVLRGLRTLTSSPCSRFSSTRTFVCDNPGSVDRARRILRDVPYVLFDCEGHSVKAASGGAENNISLVQLGTPHAEDVFIFDMLTLGQKSARAAIGNVLAFLCDPRILKIGWGGVGDFVAMMRIYGKPIVPFLDLQLVDIHSRIRRRETREVQVARLASGVFPASAVAKLQIDGVHRLSGMDRALIEHGLADVPLKESHRGRWFERPLAYSDIRYASNDIIRISELHNHFRDSRMLTTGFLPDVIAQTAMYMQLHGPRGILHSRKRFVPSYILPLDIIDISVSRGTFFTRNRNLNRCKRCHRALPFDCFPVSHGSAPNEERLEVCKVCVYFMRKEEYILRRAAQAAMKFAKNVMKTQ